MKYFIWSDTGVGLAPEKLAGASAADEFAGVNDGAASGEDDFERAFGADAVENGLVHDHVACIDAQKQACSGGNLDVTFAGSQDDQSNGFGPASMGNADVLEAVYPASI